MQTQGIQAVQQAKSTAISDIQQQERELTSKALRNIESKINSINQQAERLLKSALEQLRSEKVAAATFITETSVGAQEQMRATEKALIEELNKFIADNKDKTERELEIIADAKIRELLDKYSETASEAAREKREFKEALQEKKEEFLWKIEEEKSRRQKEQIEAQKELQEREAETRVDEAKIKAQEKAKAKYKYEKTEAERLHRQRLESAKEAIRTTWEEFTRMINDPTTLRKLALTTGLTISGILTVKYMLPLLRKKLEDILFTPDLIDDSSFTGFAGYFTQKAVPDQKIVNLFFDEKLKKQINTILSVLEKTSKNKGYYLNYLFYGPPGTGKTATTRALAYESGMDYAIMSGGNVQTLLKSGKAEEKLKEVFNWAKKSKKGLILFIDEADAFLKDPAKYPMTDELYAVLNSFLNMTGTESKDIAIILSTNHPQNLPPAVLDRVAPGQFIHFGLPAYQERLRIARHFVDKYLGPYFETENMGSDGEFLLPEVDQKLKDEIIEYIAKATEGFSGRNISYLILAIEKVLQAEDQDKVTKELIDRMVKEAVEQQEAAKQFASYA